MIKVTFLTDNPNSWIMPFVKDLIKKLEKIYDISHIYREKDIEDGEILFILSCEKVLSEGSLKKNKQNIVVHPSKLPKGKGFSPIAWEILKGNNEIYFTVFEASKYVDSGKIYYQEKIILEGHELNEEIKAIQGIKTIRLIEKFLKERPAAREQIGEETFNRRRKIKDSELDVNKSIKSQFGLLRIVDNERYPAFFKHMGQKYIIKIYKDDE